MPPIFGTYSIAKTSLRRRIGAALVPQKRPNEELSAHIDWPARTSIPALVLSRRSALRKALVSNR
jgi:hypothetical protein